MEVIPSLPETIVAKHAHLFDHLALLANRGAASNGVSSISKIVRIARKFDAGDQ